MDSVALQIVVWALSAIGAIVVFTVGVWMRSEHRQDQKIDSLVHTNSKEHRDLHDKIESNHHAIRDRLDNIWAHIKTPGD